MIPSDITLESGESLIFSTRRHFFNYLPILLAAVIVLAVLSFASGWLVANPNVLGAAQTSMAMSFVVILGVLVSVIALIAYAVYRRSLIVLTNMHLFVIAQAGLFNRSVSKLTLDEVQDAQGIRNGFFATIFNYGLVEIETSGADQNFRFSYAPDPISLAERISDQHEEFERQHTYERP